MDWKLLFHQLFALEIKKELVLAAPDGEQEEIYTRLLNGFVQYSPRPFNELIEEAMGAESAQQAREIRDRFYEHPVSRALVRTLDFSISVGAEARRSAEVRDYLASIERHRDRLIAPDENFFASPEGANVAAAFARDRDGAEQKVALVMIPGYAAHTIAHPIFEELVADANAYHGRAPMRPLLRQDGLDLEFEDYRSFYGDGADGEFAFDVLHPAGSELGNTTGKNEETTDLIVSWVENLPERYDNTKLIFLGYSKGAPIVLDIARRHPRMGSRILGYVTHAGVLQGAHAARFFLEQFESVLRDVSMREFIERLRAEDPESVAALLSPLFAQIDLGWLSLPRVRAVFDMLGFDTAAYGRQVDRVLTGREVTELLDGIRDLTPQERVRWSLVHSNDDCFDKATYLFNLSGVTDVRDFVRPVDPTNGGRAGPSLVAPTFGTDGEFDWVHFSIDALVLFFTSIAGFKNSPGGLFDTQVDLGGSKALHLDPRPLEASLLPNELDSLWNDSDVRAAMTANGINDREAFAKTPRCQLIKPENRSNIDTIDLGEFRGHHWSLFRQAFRPPPELSQTHAVWGFPRKAYMRALLQLLALRNLVDSRASK